MDLYDLFFRPTTHESIAALKLRISSYEKVDKVLFRNDAWEIYLVCKPNMQNCHTCGASLTLHGWIKTRYFDEPFHELAVSLLVKRPRYCCSNCKKTFTAQVDFVRAGQRITKRLETHILGNLRSSLSVRDLASSLRISPKTIISLLQKYIVDTKRKPTFETEIGVHWLMLNGTRHLALSNLSEKTVMNYLPALNNSVADLCLLLMGSNDIEVVRVVAMATDLTLIKGIRSVFKNAKLELSINSIYFLVAEKVAQQLASESRQGRRGSIPIKYAKQLAVMRKCSLSDDEVCLIDRNAFGKLFYAKEELLAQWECSEYCEWINIFRVWFKELPFKWRPVFHDVMHLLIEAERLGATIQRNRSYESVENSIDNMQWLINKSGRSLSPENIDALILTAPVIPNTFPLKNQNILLNKSLFLWSKDIRDILNASGQSQ